MKFSGDRPDFFSSNVWRVFKQSLIVANIKQRRYDWIGPRRSSKNITSGTRNPQGKLKFAKPRETWKRGF